jgi:hypothetical protein
MNKDGIDVNILYFPTVFCQVCDKNKTQRMVVNDEFIRIEDPPYEYPVNNPHFWECEDCVEKFKK